ncbi:isocitrate lyase/PEP mutase family protein [Sphingomonas bacterium]|uniref:isocitrate lyase/PEP mutase family protein n=1 Tax=Sphingomonas bacterium TaxID=1895847 RepID=UPI00157734A2|nr:isocitrate lyase/PEP mutase family protein [Sphingomonas bacterium]
MSATSPSRARFQRLLAGDVCVVPAAVFDPLSARVADRLGFAAAMLPGSLASHAMLAAPDNLTLTLTELAGLCARITRVAALPLVVDADHGFGGVPNVRRTIEELEAAGVAAITIEDTLLPPPFGSAGKAALVSIAEGRAKLRAALDARHDPGLAIVGRTSAAEIAGFGEALSRVRAYQAEGADALFVIGLTTLEQLEEIAGECRAPLILAGVGPALDDPSLLARHGVRMLLRRHLTLRRATEAVARTLIEQQGIEGTTTVAPGLDDLLTDTRAAQTG